MTRTRSEIVFVQLIEGVTYKASVTIFQACCYTLGKVWINFFFFEKALPKYRITFGRRHSNSLLQGRYYGFFQSFFGGLECDSHSFANLAHFVFLRDVWIRTQRAVVASRCATSLATHVPT